MFTCLLVFVLVLCSLLVYLIMVILVECCFLFDQLGCALQALLVGWFNMFDFVVCCGLHFNWQCLVWICLLFALCLQLGLGLLGLFCFRFVFSVGLVYFVLVSLLFMFGLLICLVYVLFYLIVALMTDLIDLIWSYTMWVVCFYGLILLFGCVWACCGFDSWFVCVQI